MTKFVFIFALTTGCLLVNTKTETCRGTNDLGPYSFYCCGFCKGKNGDVECKFEDFSYTFSYYSCYTYYTTNYVYWWGGGAIAGVVIGSLIGIAVLTACIIFIVKMCRRKQPDCVILPSGHTSGFSVVLSSTTPSSYPVNSNIQNYSLAHPINQSTPNPAYQQPSSSRSEQSPYPLNSLNISSTQNQPPSYNSVIN